jgi:hypothetical protein
MRTQRDYRQGDQSQEPSIYGDILLGKDPAAKWVLTRE